MHRRVEVAAFAASALLFAGLTCAFTGPGGDVVPVRDRATAGKGSSPTVPREWSRNGVLSEPVLYCMPREWSDPII
jgi:hypothetical protein